MTHKIVSERFVFSNKKGIGLSGVLEKPADADPVHYAVFTHCFTCSKNYKGVVHVSRTLAEKGIATLRFDLSGLGDSAGDFSETTFRTNVEDLISATEFLKREFVSPSLLIGHSLGGAATIAAAENIPSIKGLITIASPFSLRHLHARLGMAAKEAEEKGNSIVIIGGRKFELRDTFFNSLLEEHLEIHLKRWKKPLLIFHSPDDRIVDFEQGIRIFRASPENSSFISLPGTDHLISRLEDAQYIAEIISTWSNRFLKSEYSFR